jgi:hypothetical protein
MRWHTPSFTNHIECINAPIIIIIKKETKKYHIYSNQPVADTISY